MSTEKTDAELAEQANQALYELCYATYSNGIGTLNREQAVIARQMWLAGYKAGAAATETP